MKAWSMMVVLIMLIMTGMVAGCSTSGVIYDLAADERSATAIVSDNVIKTAIQGSLLEDREMKILDISVYCYNGSVYLVGEYDKDAQREKAVKIAKSTKGVKQVEARLFPKRHNDACTLKDNLIIKGKMEALLLADEDIWTPIDVSVVQCTIILLGITETREELSKAVMNAKSLEGTRGVISYLKSTE